MRAAQTQQLCEVPLAELRGDLQVVAAADEAGIVVHDPLRQRYYRFDETAAQLLSLWPSCRTVSELAHAANTRFDAGIDAARIETFVQFLADSQLVIPSEVDGWRRLAAIARKGRQSWLGWLIHNYLFVKIPLVRPQRALSWLAPHLAFLFTRAAAIAVVYIGVLGLYLVTRQWDAFVTTFSHMMTVEGALAFALTLVVVKSLHELGHAITAVHYGCRVPTMGVCFMVLVPMLYTDVSDAWRLRSGRQRLAIDSAGLVVETSLACLATLAWAVLPDGVSRSIAFAIATTSWLLSLGLNLNPFMRFDGYYILADFLGIDNLQQRSFALARWQMRELLLGLGADPPERLPPLTRRWLVVYAWATWLYRLVLFVGIALLVYHIGFKLLGIALFLVEIIYFVLGPIWGELKEWCKVRARIIERRRGLCFGAVVVLALVAAFVPFSTSIMVPALVEDRDLVQVFPPRSSRIVETFVRSGEHVEVGAPLLALNSPEIEQEIRRTELKIASTRWRIARSAGDRVDRGVLIVLEQTFDSELAKLAGLRNEMAELQLIAPVSGRVVDLTPNLHVGRWLQRADIVTLIAPGVACGLRGYVAEDNVARIDLAAPGQFVPEVLTSPRLRIRVERISAVGTGAMDLHELSSHYGGGVAARLVSRVGEARQLVPVTGQFLLSGQVVKDEDNCFIGRSLRGTLHLTGRAESSGCAHLEADSQGRDPRKRRLSFVQGSLTYTRARNSELSSGIALKKMSDIDRCLCLRVRPHNSGSISALWQFAGASAG